MVLAVFVVQAEIHGPATFPVKVEAFLLLPGKDRIGQIAAGLRFRRQAKPASAIKCLTMKY
jgi:hypothetical protein